MQGVPPKKGIIVIFVWTYLVIFVLCLSKRFQHGSLFAQIGCSQPFSDPSPPLPSLAPEALDQVCFSPLPLHKIHDLHQQDVSG
jgi:hypothetical protein